MAVSVGGFHVINVKLNEKCSSPHLLYYKRHTVRDEDADRPPDKTIFVVNVPPYCTKGALKRVFGDCGPIKDVFIMKQPGPTHKDKTSLVNAPSSAVEGFKVAYVVFKALSSVDKALELDTSESCLLSTAENPILTGIKKWCHEYSLRYPSPQHLQKEVDTFMETFDKEQVKIKMQKASTEGQPDEEGWVTVGRRGRKPGAPRVDAATIQENKKKKNKNALLNFYNFQQRESRREHIATLRKKFEEDKMKIEQMKSQRKFRPY